MRSGYVEYDPKNFSTRDRREIERQIDGRPRRVRRGYDMHTRPLDLLERELDAVARTTLGRRAFDGLPWEIINAPHCHNLAELARSQQCGPEGENAYVGIAFALRFSKTNPMLELFALVSMRPALARILSLVDPHGRHYDAAAVLVGEFHALVPQSGLEQREFVEDLRRATRRVLRREELRTTRTAPLDPDYDEIEIDSDPAETTGDVLARLVRSGYLSQRDGEILVRSHVRNEDLSALAEERGVSYRTLQSQRLRAEKAAQVYLLREANS